MFGYKSNGEIVKHKKIGHLSAMQRSKPFVVADFESNETWTYGSADTTNFVSGKQGRSVTASAGQSTGTHRVVDMNLYRKNFTIDVYCADITNNAGMSIMFSIGDSAFTKYVYYPITPTINGWSRKTFNFADGTFYGGATKDDLRNVKHIKVNLTATAGGAITATVDRFLAYDSILDKGTIVLTFDDGMENIFTNAKPILDKYGYKGTIFAVTDWIGTEGKMTLDNLRTLRDQGWIISSHTKTHQVLTTLDAVTLSAELVDSKAYLLENGFNPHHNYVAYPTSATNATVLEETRKSYLAGFHGINKYFAEIATDRYMIPRLALGTVANAKTILDDISTHKLCAITNVHKVLPTDGDYTPAEFEEIIDYIHTLGINVITSDDLVRMFY